MWQVMSSTLLSEFSEITDLSHFIRIIFRIMLAAILGGLLGYDRELKGRTAGLRTHMLVSLGRRSSYLFLNKREPRLQI